MGALVPQSPPKTGGIVINIKFRGVDITISLPGFVFLQLLTLLSSG